MGRRKAARCWELRAAFDSPCAKELCVSDPSLHARQTTPPGSMVLRHRLGRGRVNLTNDSMQNVHTKLSLRARGLLGEMVSRPPDWRFSVERIAANSPTEGREAVTTAMRELEDAGYVIRKAERGRGGKITTVVRVSDVPIPEWAAYAAAKRASGDPDAVDGDLPEAGEPYDPWGDATPPVAPNAGQPEPGQPEPVQPIPVDPWALQGQDHKGQNDKTEGHNGSSAAGGRVSEFHSGLRARRNGATRVDAGVSRTPFADLQAVWDEDGDYETVYEALDAMLNGIDPFEESTVLGMLESGAHVKAVYNKILANREGR